MTDRAGALYLAFDGGGTATRAALYDADQNAIAQETAGPSNPVALGIPQCVATLMGLGRSLLAGRDASICVVAAGISGARNRLLRDAIAVELQRALGVQRAVVSSDVDALIHANVGDGAGMVVIAGTGSSAIVKAAGREPRIFGGRGALFGDMGSAYQIAERALRIAAESVDGLEPPTGLVQALPKAAGVKKFAELIGWSMQASKQDVARLAPCVSKWAENGDAVAQTCVSDEAHRLARLTHAASEAVKFPPNAPIYMSGGLFERCPLYTRWYETFLPQLIDPCSLGLAPLRGPDAALCMVTSDSSPRFASDSSAIRTTATPAIPRTEWADTDRVPLDALTAIELVERMHDADRQACDAIHPAMQSLAGLIERVAGAFAERGRLVYLGAGTSGRLGVLDASECPPTFGVDPGQVVGIIAGGDAALRSSGEGAEDDEAAAVVDLQALKPALCNRDVVVGIAASGTTPYVHAGLSAGKKAGAYTCLLCCNPFAVGDSDCIIALDTGPEVLPGSTRLKAGTATKLALNMISTGAMVLSGRVFEGYMVGVRPMNVKLRKRAVRIVSALTGQREPPAAELLKTAGDSIPVSVLMARLNLTREDAEMRLKKAKGNLRAALEPD